MIPVQTWSAGRTDFCVGCYERIFLRHRSDKQLSPYPEDTSKHRDV